MQAQIDAQRRRFGEDLHDLHQSSATLHAADATLAAFSHFADSQTGARLLVTTNFGVRVLDVDRSTDSAVDLGAGAKPIVAFGSVYVTSQGRLFRLPANLAGNGHDLGPGATVLPAPNGQLWVSTEDNSLRLVTTGGQTVWGPQPVTFGLAGSVNAGVVIADPATEGFAVVDPRTGITIRPIVTGASDPILVSASGDTVAYTLADDIDLHVVTVSTGAVRSIPVLTPGSHQTGVGVFSPDGRRLATYEISGAGVATPIVVDLASGAVTRLTNVSNADPALSMTWTADSARLFFTVNEDGASLATWQVGAPSAVVLRWRTATASSVAVLP